MKDEIKEIREYISCPQFGDDHYGKWGALRLDQRIKIKQLLDYITNLQEELEKEKRIEQASLDTITNLQEENKRLLVDNKTLKRWYKLCKSRNEKAIEYIPAFRTIIQSNEPGLTCLKVLEDKLKGGNNE